MTFTCPVSRTKCFLTIILLLTFSNASALSSDKGYLQIGANSAYSGPRHGLKDYVKKSEWTPVEGEREKCEKCASEKCSRQCLAPCNALGCNECQTCISWLCKCEYDGS